MSKLPSIGKLRPIVYHERLPYILRNYNNDEFDVLSSRDEANFWMHLEEQTCVLKCNMRCLPFRQTKETESFNVYAIVLFTDMSCLLLATLKVFRSLPLPTNLQFKHFEFFLRMAKLISLIC